VIVSIYGVAPVLIAVRGGGWAGQVTIAMARIGWRMVRVSPRQADNEPEPAQEETPCRRRCSDWRLPSSSR
jgi:hypothetical protein